MNQYTDQDYYNNEALSSSKMKMLLECPRKFYHHYVNQDTPLPESAIMSFGKKFHTLLLEGENKFFEQYYLTKKIIRNPKHAAYQEVLAQAGEKEIVFYEEFETLDFMTRRVMQDKRLRNALSSGDAEKELYWTDTDNELSCKAKLDFINYEKGIIIDVKKVQSADKFSFMKACERYKYNVQAAHYLEACKQNDIPIKQFMFLVIEDKAPHITEIYTPSDRFLDEGYMQIQNAKEIYKSSMTSGVWNTYNESIEEIDLPEWAYKEAI